MPNENDFIPYAAAFDANVETQIQYLADPALSTGVVSGIAKSSLYNKVARQASIMSAMIGQFISNTLSVNVIDDGSTATILANFKLAVTTTLISVVNTWAQLQTFSSGILSNFLQAQPGVVLSLRSDQATQSANIAGSALVPHAASQIDTNVIQANAGTPLFLESDVYTASVNRSNTAYNEHYVAPASINQAAVNLGQFVNNFQGKGSAQLPGGLIIQWGTTATIPASTIGLIEFDFPFPNGSLSITASYTNDTATNQATAGNPFNLLNAFGSTNGFAIYNGGTASSQYSWIALGY